MEGPRPHSELKMLLWFRAAAVSPGGADDLSPRYPIAALDVDPLGVRIGRDITIVVPDQNEIAVTLKLVADIADGAGIRGVHRRTELRGNVDAVIAPAAGSLAKGRNDPALYRPEEFLLRNG